MTRGSVPAQAPRVRGMSSWDDDGDDLLLPREREAVAGLTRNAARLLGLESNEGALSVLAAALRSAMVRSVELRSGSEPQSAPGPQADPRTTRWLAEQLRRQQTPAFLDPHEQQAAEVVEPLLSPPRPLALRRAVAAALRRAKAHVYGDCQRMAEEVAATLRHLGYMDSALTVDDLAAAFEETAHQLSQPE